MAQRGRILCFRLRDIPKGIRALGFVSMLMDVLSEMIHARLPNDLVTAFDVSAGRNPDIDDGTPGWMQETRQRFTETQTNQGEMICF